MCQHLTVVGASMQGWWEVDVDVGGCQVGFGWRVFTELVGEVADGEGEDNKREDQPSKLRVCVGVLDEPGSSEGSWNAQGQFRKGSGEANGRLVGMGMGRVVFYVLVAFGDGEGGERGVAQPGGVGEDEGRDEDGAVLGDARDANLR